MDKEILLSEEVQAFIRKHENDDLNKLLLQRDRYASFPIVAIVNQISARRKAKNKLPIWFETKNILYPASVSLEQSSSEQTAKYKASFLSGEKGLDLTGGLGVDSYYFSKAFSKFYYVESNKELCQLAENNFKRLGVKNIIVTASKAEDFLLATKTKFDLVYIDPDRRPESKRVISFSDSTPNVPDLLPALRKITNRVMIKASPMMDIKLGAQELTHVNNILVVSVNNEVKELLYCINFDIEAESEIRCIDINKTTYSSFIFKSSEELQEKTPTGLLQNYLYEPRASILKGGGFNVVGHRYGLNKLHRNTHLYTSVKLQTEFPGRIFKVLANINYSKKELMKVADLSQANLSARNFVDTPDQMKKKLKLRDGGSTYIFGFRDHRNKNMLAVCVKPDEPRSDK